MFEGEGRQRPNSPIAFRAGQAALSGEDAVVWDRFDTVPEIVIV